MQSPSNKNSKLLNSENKSKTSLSSLKNLLKIMTLCLVTILLILYPKSIQKCLIVQSSIRPKEKLSNASKIKIFKGHLIGPDF